MSIITKKGDEGFTTLFDGTKVIKSDEQPRAYGTIDELFSFLGIIKIKLKTNDKNLHLMEIDEINQIISDKNYEDIKSFFRKTESLFNTYMEISFHNIITFIQKRLIVLMGELAVKKENCEKYCKKRISEKDIRLIEIICYTIEKTTEKFNFFIIPGTNEEESFLNYARTITRKAEREVVAIKGRLNEDSKIIPFLNRLSDLLFLISLVYYENNC